MKESGSSHLKNILLILLAALIPALLVFNALSGSFSGRRKKAQEDTADHTPPSIMLTRDNRYFVYPGEQYEEEGYAAYDNLDGDLTKKVEVSINGDMVRYRVADSAGNIAIRFRKIPYSDRDDSDTGIQE